MMSRYIIENKATGGHITEGQTNVFKIFKSQAEAVKYLEDHRLNPDRYIIRRSV
jgi:hypothetical protein